MKKNLKKYSKKVFATIVAIALIFTMIIPFVEVFAQDSHNITLNFNDSTSISGNAVTYTIGEESVTATINGNYSLNDGVLTIGNESWLTAITLSDNYDSETMQIRVYEKNVENPFGATYSYSNGTLTRNGNPGGLPNTLWFAVEEKGSNDNTVEPGEEFDGRAVVLWSCGTGDVGVCYHEFSVVNPANCDPENPTDACDPEIGDFDDGNSTYFSASSVTADNKPGTTFDVHATYRGWYLTDEFENWQYLYEVATGSQINWETLEPEIILGDPKDGNTFGQLEADAAGTCGQKPPQNASRARQKEYERCINLYAAQENHEIWTHKLQPVGEPTDKNAYVSYGDRNFKVVIYNENYKGVTTTADFEGLNFYPASWADPFLRTDQYDVSETTQAKPTGLNSILLEDTVNFDVLPYNNYELESIEALDVPAGAVTINKINSRKFQIVFSSNFYDHVVFRLNDTNGGASYVQIKRATIDGWIRDGHTLSADFYFDKDKSYNQFKLTAKVIYYDGTIQNVTLEPQNGFMDGLGNPIQGYEADQEESEGPFQGKGLKQSVFEYYLGENADRNVKDIYLNAEYIDEDADEYTYAGAYAGSGEGTPANLYHPEEDN